jgi:hypothetical protein
VVDFSPGDRVEADISGTVPGLEAGFLTPATVFGPGEAPGTLIVQTDAPCNGATTFELEPNHLRLLGD